MPVTKLEAPCWEAWCDKCEEGTNPDGGTYHHVSEEEALGALRDLEWYIVVNEEEKSIRAVYCDSCVDKMTSVEKRERGIVAEDYTPFDFEDTGVDP